MNRINSMSVRFDARSANEAFARVTVAAFITELNPTMDEVEDVKTAVSEAVTNAIIHAYDDPTEQVQLCCRIDGNRVELEVKDTGKGIGDLKKRWSLSIQQSRSLSVPVWALRLWRLLWMRSG